jgi:hypothetical protein
VITETFNAKGIWVAVDKTTRKPITDRMTLDHDFEVKLPHPVTKQVAMALAENELRGRLIKKFTKIMVADRELCQHALNWDINQITMMITFK